MSLKIQSLAPLPSLLKLRFSLFKLSVCSGVYSVTSFHTLESQSLPHFGSSQGQPHILSLERSQPTNENTPPVPSNLVWCLQKDEQLVQKEDELIWLRAELQGTNHPVPRRRAHPPSHLHPHPPSHLQPHPPSHLLPHPPSQPVPRTHYCVPCQGCELGRLQIR